MSCGRSGQSSISRAKSGSNGRVCATRASDFATQVSKIAVFDLLSRDVLCLSGVLYFSPSCLSCHPNTKSIPRGYEPLWLQSRHAKRFDKSKALPAITWRKPPAESSRAYVLEIGRPIISLYSASETACLSKVMRQFYGTPIDPAPQPRPPDHLPR